MIWLVVGVVLGIGLYHVASRSLSGRLRVRWYQWLLGLLAVAMFLLALQNYLALQDEFEPTLAIFSLLAFGLAGVLSTALLWAIPWVADRMGGAKRNEPKPKVKMA